MQSKIRAVVSGFGACAALGLFLVGVPLILVWLVGNPLPAGLSDWSSAVAAVEAGALPEGLARSVLAVTVWIWWTQVALSFAAEVRAAWRGRPARPLPLRALGAQPLVVRLVAVVVAAAATVGTLAQPAVAATPSFAEITVPMNAGSSSGGQPVGTTIAAPHATVAGPLAAVAGSPPVPILGLPEFAGVDPEPAAATQAAVGLSSPGSVAGSPATPILGPPAAAVMEPAPPPPILGTPVSETSDASQPQRSPSPVAPGSEGSRPVPGDPVPAPSPAGQPDQTAVSPPVPPSARWDPVPEPSEVAQSDQGPVAGPAAGSVSAPFAASAAGVVSAPVASPAAISVSAPVASPAAISVAAPVAAPAANPDGSGWVVVKPGDSLWLLAERHLGDALRWQDIFDLNVGQLEGGGTLRDPNLIHPGWRLRLPPPDRIGPADAAGSTAPDTPIDPYDLLIR